MTESSLRPFAMILLGLFCMVMFLLVLMATQGCDALNKHVEDRRNAQRSWMQE